ncbi:uncharacterized protein ACBT57_027264 isoform 1-T1 [Dama dama]
MNVPCWPSQGVNAQGTLEYAGKGKSREPPHQNAIWLLQDFARGGSGWLGAETLAPESEPAEFHCGRTLRGNPDSTKSTPRPALPPGRGCQTRDSGQKPRQPLTLQTHPKLQEKTATPHGKC